jgi:hypothetical protein
MSNFFDKIFMFSPPMVLIILNFNYLLIDFIISDFHFIFHFFNNLLFSLNLIFCLLHFKFYYPIIISLSLNISIINPIVIFILKSIEFICSYF